MKIFLIFGSLNPYLNHLTKINKTNSELFKLIFNGKEKPKNTKTRKKRKA